MNDDKETISPARADAGVTTAPVLSAADEIAGLRTEVARLKALLFRKDQDEDVGPWPLEIDYADSPYSGSRLGGITKDHDGIRSTTDISGLPEPTQDRAQLEADFMRRGYCVVSDAFTLPQVRAQKARLLDQAET